MRNSRNHLLANLGILLVLAATLFPVAYLVLTSVKPAALLLQRPPRIIFPPTFDGYVQVLTQSNFPSYFLNSVVVTSLSVLFALTLGTLGAYAIANFRFFFRRTVLFTILLTRVFPPVTTLLPIFFVMRFLNLIDTRAALILVYTGTQIPLVMWVMQDFFADVPREIQESAQLDGCSHLQLFLRIMLPLTRPGLVASGILIFILTWNEFLFALTLTSFNAKTTPVAIMAFIEAEGALQWGTVAVLGTITILPIVAFAMALNRYLVKGLTSGALKG